MEAVEFTGKTTEEALQAAQEHFSLSLDQLEVEVVRAGGGGFLGLGSKKAVVRVKPRGKSQADEVAELVAEMTEGSSASLGLGKNKPEPKPKPEKKPEPAPQAKPKPAVQPAPKAESRPAPPAESRPAPRPKPPAPAKPAPRPAPPAKPSPPPQEAPPATARSEAPSEPRRQKSEREEDGPEVLAYAGEVLTRLARSLDPKAAVEARKGDQGVELSINGGEPGVLIGRRGQTLDALQYLTTRIVSHKYGRAVHLSVDAGGYRSRRRSALEDMARKAADKARATRKPQGMGPLSAQERRVVHLVLRSQKGISTVSRGKGELKKVVITPR